MRSVIVAFVLSILSAIALAGDDLPEGFKLINQTKSGKAMMTEKSDVEDVAEAIEDALEDLGGYFGDDENFELGQVFEDQQDHRTAIAGFNAIHGEHKVRGAVIARLVGEEKASVVVIFCRADATAEEWKALTQPPKDDAAAPQRAEGQPKQEEAEQKLPELKEYRFADGTGSIHLADGWRTEAQTCMQGFEVKGPADQLILCGYGYTVNTPDSTAVQMQRQFGGGAPMLVAPLCEPVEAIQRLVPQISQLSVAAGGPAIEVDNVKKIPGTLPPMLPNSKFTVATFGLTKITQEGKKHYQAAAQVAVTPITAEGWSFWFSEVIAPDETAKRDIPLMSAMLLSWKTNDKVVAQKTNEWVANSNRNFQAQQAAHRELVKTYEAHNAAYYKSGSSSGSSNASGPTTADKFSETIRGYREVEDTRTGERKSVDLGNVDDIVDRLNEADPGRYKQIPLGQE